MISARTVSEFRQKSLRESFLRDGAEAQGTDPRAGSVRRGCVYSSAPRGWIFASAKSLGGKIGNGDEFFFNLAKNSGLGECFGYS